MKRRGILFVISSPSGTGKTTLSRLLLQRQPEMGVSVSMTTRAPRPQEKEGVDYFFVGTEVFENHVQRGDFVEHVSLFSHRYGTPVLGILEALERGQDLLFDVDEKGAHALKQRFPEETVTVFLLPPSMDELKRRLEERPEKQQDVVQQRWESAKKEIKAWQTYDYALINQHLDRSLSDLLLILEAERLKRHRQVDMAHFVHHLESF